jgi:phosphoribosylglycinamide formyltransferase-1
MTDLRVAVLASGRGTNLQAILDACQDGRVDATPAVAVSDDRDAQALDRAEKAGVPARLVDPEDRSRREHEEAVADVVDGNDAELVCLAGYLRVLSDWFVERYRGRLVNVHPSILPSFKGLHGQRDALEHGVKVAGCTTHFVTEEVDAGPVIMQAAVPVAADDTVDDLADRILAQEHEIYPRTIQLFADDRISLEGRTVHIDGLDEDPRPRALRWPPVDLED